MEPSASVSSGLRHVVLQTDWYPQAEHGGFYQALAKGYYRDAGLDVEIHTGGPGSSIKLKVARGDADFGMNRSDDTILAVSRGLPLIMVGTTLQHDPQALLLHADSPVKTFADLEGRTIHAALGMTWIPYIKHKYGIEFSLVPTTYGMASFLSDPTAIQQCFLTSEPYFARQRGFEVRTLAMSASGYDMYNTIICRKALVRDKPNLVRAFVTASNRGWASYIDEDPSPANRLILARNENMTLAQLEYSRQAMIAHSLVRGYPEKGEGVGWLSMERVAREIAILRKFKILEKPIEASDVATDAFAPPNL